MRLPFRRHEPADYEPATTLTFPRGIDTAEEYLASLRTPHGRRALETKLRVDAQTARRRGR